jgi:hypothetical protein
VSPAAHAACTVLAATSRLPVTGLAFAGRPGAFFGCCPKRGGSAKRRASQFGTSTEGETDIESSNGQSHSDSADGDGLLELRDVLVIETTDGKQLEFEVVGLVEDDENNAFAVCYSEKADEFVVTDATGTLLDDDELAQEILDDFFVLADESSPETQA